MKHAFVAVGIVVVTVAATTALMSHVVRFARVEGQSMAPTLNDRDRLVVDKRVYRVGDPANGDIVMHLFPQDPERVSVKRVIASPGDEVRIAGGVVFRNGVKLDEPYVSVAHRSHDQWGPAAVPVGRYFVLGDHRNNSLDSRQWGFIPRESILGRITTRWWPLPAARRF